MIENAEEQRRFLQTQWFVRRLHVDGSFTTWSGPWLSKKSAQKEAETALGKAPDVTLYIHKSDVYRVSSANLWDGTYTSRVWADKPIGPLTAEG